MSLRNRSRLVKLETHHQPTKGADWWEWHKAQMSILLDQAYDGVSQEEAQRLLRALGTEPPTPTPVPLFVECAEILNQVYASPVRT